MIKQEIKEARALYSMFGDSLKGEREFAEGMQKYEGAISETYAQMAGRGITQACSICSSKQAGCCVNYLCPNLAASMGEDEKRKLLSISGKELLCGWDLEKSLRSWLASRVIEQVNMSA